MAIFNTRAKQQIRELTGKLETAQTAAAAARADAADALKKANRIQELLVDNILSVTEVEQRYVGNDYRDYGTAIQAISDKYISKSEWGCVQTGTIIDLRAAFILGEGIKVVHKTDTKAEAETELQFANDFLEYNSLDAEMAQELAKEVEIEGKLALRLKWDDLKNDPFRGRTGLPSVRFISWLAKKYTVTPDPNDYMWFKTLSWIESGKTEKTTINEPEFVYKKFGGRITDPNDAQPKIMKCLTEIDRLDRALRDLREILHLFASPTPDFECATAQDAKALIAYLTDTNWRIGKAIVHIGSFSYKSPDTAGVTNLIAEIETTTKMISGTTGVPIHYLGLLDLLKNRATGDNTRELVMAATTRERSIWIGAYTELIEKAMAMFNAKTGSAQKSTKLDPEKIGVTIPLISQDHWNNLQNVLIPAFTAGIVSKEFVASQIPGVDMDDEAAKAEAADASELESAKRELERMRTERLAAAAAGGGNGGSAVEDEQ